MNKKDFIVEYKQDYKKSWESAVSKIFDLEKENQQLKDKIEYLKNKIENKDKWCQLIVDIGYDYDGFNKVDSLKGLIDELVKYALYSRDDYNYLEWLKEDNKEE